MFIRVTRKRVVFLAVLAALVTAGGGSRVRDHSGE